MAEHQGLGHETGSAMATSDFAAPSGLGPILAFIFALTTILAVSALGGVNPAWALSEFKPAQAQETENQPESEAPPLEGPLTGDDGGLPPPGPVIRDMPEAGPNAETDGEDPGTSEALVSVEVITDLTTLPEAVLRIRELMIEAAATGDPEQLRGLLGIGDQATQLALSDIDTDPVDYIRATSGDGQGLEILAILIDLLNTAVVRVDQGEPGEIYIWPYLAALPLDGLTPAQQVDLLRIVTAGDVEDMRAYGGYNFYRVGISPEGEWRFFMAGD